MVTCAYDSMGRRSFKQVTVNGSVTLHQRYLYRGYLQIACIDLTRSHHPGLWLITRDPTQSVATRPLAIQKEGTWYTYGLDLTKNVCEVFGSTGYIATTYTYSPYGSVATTGSVTQPIQWSSEVWDNELGTVYYNWRYYNSLMGRWLTRDSQEEENKNLFSLLSGTHIYTMDYLGLRPTGKDEDVTTHVIGLAPIRKNRETWRFSDFIKYRGKELIRYYLSLFSQTRTPQSERNSYTLAVFVDDMVNVSSNELKRFSHKTITALVPDDVPSYVKSAFSRELDREALTPLWEQPTEHQVNTSYPRISASAYAFVNEEIACNYGMNGRLVIVNYSETGSGTKLEWFDHHLKGHRVDTQSNGFGFSLETSHKIEVNNHDVILYGGAIMEYDIPTDQIKFGGHIGVHYSF